MSGHVSRDLRLMRHSSYTGTQNGDAALRYSCIFTNIEAVPCRKYGSLLYLVNHVLTLIKKKDIYEISPNDMFLQC